MTKNYGVLVYKQAINNMAMNKFHCIVERN
jgi:hypothetical protein